MDPDRSMATQRDRLRHKLSGYAPRDLELEQDQRQAIKRLRAREGEEEEVVDREEGTLSI